MPGVPVTPLILVVTVIVADIGAFVVLLVVNTGILPVPFAARPIAVLLFVQLFTVPTTEPLKFTNEVGALLHTA